MALRYSRIRRRLLYWAARVLLWKFRDRPQRMYRNGRDCDDQFDGDELFFMRVKKEWLDDDGRVMVAFVACPDQSVNRERYSRRWDVLLPNEGQRDLIDWGVVEAKVDDIPEPISVEKYTFKFRVEHDAIDDNFGHSEIRVYRDDKRRPNVSKTAKKHFRMKLHQRLMLAIIPEL